jgi:outer membrane protein
LLRIELSIYSTSFNMNNVCLLKRFLIPILVFFLFLPDKGLTQNRIWTLEDCIYYAFENNLQIKQSALNVKNFEISKLEAKLSLIPNLNSDASFSYNWGRVLDRTNYTYTDKETNQANFGIHANMRLFGGLQLQNQIKKASLDFFNKPI